MITLTESTRGGSIAITGLATTERIVQASGTFDVNNNDEFILTNLATSDKAQKKSYNIGKYTNVVGYSTRQELFDYLLDFFGKPADSGLEVRVESLENTIVKVAYYEDITEVSGQISPPQGTTILLDQWANGVDAVLSEIVGTQPNYEDTGLDCTLDISGNYTVSGALPSNPSALIYYFSISLKDYSNLDLNRVIEQVQLVASVTTETNPIQVKAISQLDQIITTDIAGMIPVPEVIQETNGIEIDSNGYITFNQEGFYRIQIQLNIDNTNNTNIDTWAEYLDGNNWLNLPNSGNVKDSGNSGIGNFIIETTLTILNPLTIRLKARTVTGTASLKYDTADGGVGVPSCTYLAYKLNPKATGILVETNNLSEDFNIGKEANGDYLTIEPDGTWVNAGEGTTWDEISSSLIGSRIDTSLGRIDYNYDELTIDFATNARYPEEPLAVVVQLMHSRKLNTEIRPHLHWVQNQDAIPNILIEYRTQNNGQQIPTIFTQKALTSSDNKFAYVSGEIQQITEFNLPPSVGEALIISGTFECRIFRDVDNSSGLFAGADTYTGVFSAKYFDVHFIKDMNGSREEFIK